MYTIVVCHSFSRCEEISEFCKELVSFCPEMLEVISLEATDINEALV
jgi:ATP-dependent RNA helicase DDX56/DBP9